MLEDSIRKFTEMDLVGQEQPEALIAVWEGVVYTPSQGRTWPLSDETLAELFAASGSSLLILGGAGAGKTFTLLRLARGLLAQAEADPLCPIPVVLNLSSWAEDEDKLGDWVLDELCAKYQIPRKFGRSWLENDRLVLLLDGYDVVPQRTRDRCVDAINQFRRDFGFTGIVVCSRTSVYFETDSRLLLGKAIQLHSLTDEQIDTYLQQAGIESAEIRARMQEAGLGNVMQTPLVLRVLTSLQTADQNEFSPPDPQYHFDEDAYLNALIEGYVEQVLDSAGPDSPL